ncbi:MAG: YrhK family protein [Candidatus Limnocylindrales bacterium]
MFTAWRHRKGHGLIDGTPRERISGIPWWAPQRRGWWIAVLFMIGSLCFALGSVPAFASAIGGAVVWVFFVGSLFFTAAAYLQYFEASNEGDDLRGSARTRRPLGVRLSSPGWWAASTQLLGTLWFNLTTFAGTRGDLDVVQQEVLVWAPDAIGSVLFLVASAFAIIEVRDGLERGWRPSLDSAIAWVNMTGSIAFGISAIAAFIDPVSGELLNVAAANAFTFLGAVCFFVGALMLMPDMTRANEPEVAT